MKPKGNIYIFNVEPKSPTYIYLVTRTTTQISTQRKMSESRTLEFPLPSAKVITRNPKPSLISIILPFIVVDIFLGIGPGRAVAEDRQKLLGCPIS